MTTKEKASKMRAMTDEELVAYVENRVRKAHSEGFNMGNCLRQKDVDNLREFVVEMHEYIIDIGSAINYTYYDGLLSYADSLYTITRKLGRR